MIGTTQGSGSLAFIGEMPYSLMPGFALQLVERCQFPLLTWQQGGGLSATLYCSKPNVRHSRYRGGGSQAPFGEKPSLGRP